MNILELLGQKKVINSKDTPALQEEMAQSGASLESVLEKKGIDPKVVLEAKGELYNLPTKSLNKQTVPFEVLKYVPEESATFYHFAPIGMQDNVLEIGIVDPDNIEARDAINFISNKANVPFKLFLISQSDFDEIIETYKGLSGEVTKALDELETVLAKEVQDQNKTVEGVDAIRKETANSESAQIIEDAPVTKIVATMLHYATQGNASDIHIEHMGERIRVRFRVDGVLNTSLVLPPNVHAAVVARIKILSNLRLDEKRKPQDGRFSATIEGRKIDFRVSTFPAYYGEKVVMRILDSERGVKAIDSMGMTPRNLRLMKEATKKPYGMILISGPTGSGKSTTLYSMLNEVDKDGKNVLSLEDPVEYNVPGMNQSQVRPEIGYTFANGLRSTLRQDPDIIMVGEIRDKETAQLAVQAALTGHLVLSTIHTNNAAGVIPRLIDMGVDPFLIAPTLVLAIAQRLVKTLCPGAGKPMPTAGSIQAMIDKQFEDYPQKYRKDIVVPEFVYDASPTPECPKGTSGRAAVFEVIEMTKDIESIILKNPTELAITKAAREQGMLSLKEDAMLKAFNKIIPWEEVNEL